MEIVKATEKLPIGPIVITIYGAPGTGKSTLAMSAHKCLLVDFDRGAHRSQFRSDVVIPQFWDEACDLLNSDLAGYETIAVDTVGTALDMLTTHIIGVNSRMGKPSGGLTLPGWGELKAEFTSWIKKLRSLGKNVIFICHDKEDKRGDELYVRPDIQGGSYGEIFKVSDAIGYLKTQGSHTVIDFSPHEDSIGKNPGVLDQLQIGDFNEADSADTLEQIIEACKLTMGDISNRVIADAAILAEFTNNLSTITEPADATAYLDIVNALECAESTVLQLKTGRNRYIAKVGIKYDKKTNQFVNGDKPKTRAKKKQ